MMPCRRITERCWDRFAFKRLVFSSIQETDFSPERSRLMISIRLAWASVLQTSAWSSYICFIVYILVNYISNFVKLLFKEGRVNFCNLRTKLHIKNGFRDSIPVR